MLRSSMPTVALLCGVALAGGTAPAAASSYKVLYRFQSGNDGSHPQAGVINVGGTLYGTTYFGGPSNSGTVFAVNPTTGAETVVYALKGGLGSSDAEAPYAGLLSVGGTLYGTAEFGGGGSGAVFAVDPLTGAETVVYGFHKKHHGAEPLASLIKVGGALFGTTLYGGIPGPGVVFALNLKKGRERVVHSFQLSPSDGAEPYASLIKVGSELYGTSSIGGGTGCSGNVGCGTVFALNPHSGVTKVLYAFQGGEDGYYPHASLLNIGGTFYGTTYNGGASGYGTVFSVNQATGAETVMHSFASGKDGANPDANLISLGGKLYGTTSQAGAFGYGTVFDVDLATGAEKVLYSFQGGKDGFDPEAALLDVGGTLYGTTRSGGSSNCGYGCGTVFSFTP